MVGTHRFETARLESDAEFAARQHEKDEKEKQNLQKRIDGLSTELQQANRTSEGLLEELAEARGQGERLSADMASLQMKSDEIEATLRVERERRLSAIEELGTTEARARKQDRELKDAIERVRCSGAQ